MTNVLKSYLTAQSGKQYIFLLTLIFVVSSCKKSDIKYDAAGTFEATEIILSAEANGKITQFDANEGDEIKAGQVVVLIDTVNLNLQKEQAESTVDALLMKQNSAEPQITVLKQQLMVAESQIQTLLEQMKVLRKEQNRVSDLFKGEAATSQQMDDVNGKVEILQKQIKTAEQQRTLVISQMKSARDQIAIQNRSITSEKIPLQKRVALINDQIRKTAVIAPLNGTILTKYAEQGEFIAIGKPILKLADLSEMSLKAYITGDQLPAIQIGQDVDVFVDQLKGESKSFKGKITSISDKAEFTPKTIQTKEERANLVYAIKINVLNDGTLKIGMYGEVAFGSSNAEK
ncbi:MAG: efflux RND transporter periplasmic adaptor subunit [Saprospiraceae bacterium]|nr:efflux RND transporter periplasmic adaptor subunit [Saprospiraceae bacterium]